MAKKCWKIDWVDCVGIPGSAYVCAEDMQYIPTGGVCGAGYLLSADYGLTRENASERSATVAQVALSYCGNACAGGQEPGAGTTTGMGKTANDPVKLTGTTVTGTGSSPNVSTKTAAAPTPVDGTSGRYSNYRPDSDFVSGSDLNLTGGSFAGQLLPFREEITIRVKTTDVTLVQAGFLNRPFPYYLAGFYQVRPPSPAVQGFIEEGQILVTTDTASGLSYFALYKERLVTLLPKKTDTKAATLATLNPCNFQLYPDGLGVVAETVITLPNFKLTGVDPSFKGKLQIPQVDLSKVSIEYYYNELGIYMAPGWAVDEIFHTLTVLNATTLPDFETQIVTTGICQQGSNI